MVTKRLWQRGQITIFFAVSVVLIVTLVTFVINVGLFVKAKINLQNATDAAAWSGAATQARQLTDIAYLNWEMRNVYKQWMFKYYVLGNLSARGVTHPGDAGNKNNVAPGSMDFTIGPFNKSADKFNIPSVCIHNRAKTNDNDACSVYTIPGLPVLTFGFPSIDQTTTILTQALASGKANDCSYRSKANFNIALQWIYGTGANDSDKKILADAPHIAINSMGAWVKAMELAHRMRNLEYIVNAKPFSDGVCNGGAQDHCANALQNLESENDEKYERVIKAFTSAYRNLGNDTAFGREIKDTFVLTEIAPQPFLDSSNSSLSNLFIPENYPKFYLDLRLMPVNFAPFFTILNSYNAAGVQGQSAAQEGACEMVKMAIPVPGYPFGFVKNPEVVTYYAVKGEATFSGLFNPFGKSISLTAFAAAKPFGGRIGPHIFDTFRDNNGVYAREIPKFRSLPYVFGLDIDPNVAPSNNNAVRLTILPFDNKFWVNKSDQPLGGNTNQTADLKYALPNLIYDSTRISNASDPLFSYKLPASANNPSPGNFGLYNVDEFKNFSSLLGTTQGIISAETVDQALLRVKAPTEYEALNYLIPTPNRVNQHDLNLTKMIDSFGFPTDGRGKQKLYAPLYGEKVLFHNSSAIIESVKSYLKIQQPSLEAYISNLFLTSQKLRSLPPIVASTKLDIYKKAADVFYDFKDYENSKLSCQSMAGQFLYYFLGHESGMSGSNLAGCSKPLPEALEEIYGENPAQNSLLDSQFSLFHSMDLNYLGTDLTKFFTAYTPGPLTGGASDNNNHGLIFNPFLNDTTFSMRNFYSTKLVSIKSLLPTSEQSLGSGTVPLLSEGQREDATKQKDFANYLKIEDSADNFPTQEIFQ